MPVRLSATARASVWRYRAETLASDATQEAAAAKLAALNADAGVHGVMILEPVPDQIRLDLLIDLLDPAKDVDGVHPINAGRSAGESPAVLDPGDACRGDPHVGRGGRGL